MKPPHEYLELYKNSSEVKRLLEPYAEMLDCAEAAIKRVQTAILVNSPNNQDLAEWLSLYKPPDCEKMTDKERICDAENFFIGAPLWRIRQVLSQMCKCSVSDIYIAETKNCYVFITLPARANFTASVYTSYIDHIKPAHIAIDIQRKRTHGMMHASTHTELSCYTHSGMKKEETT